jgi:hypothetical protein
MNPDRRRRIARELLDALDAIPVGVDGPGDFSPNDLVATMKIEAALIGQLTDAIERAHRIEKALDSALVALGGWRHVTLTELQGDEAEQLYRLFADQTIADK